MFASGGYGFGRKKRSVDVEETSAAAALEETNAAAAVEESSAAAARPGCQSHADCSPPWEDCANGKCWRYEEASYLKQTFGLKMEDWIDANLPIEITQQNKGTYKKSVILYMQRMLDDNDM